MILSVEVENPENMTSMAFIHGSVKLLLMMIPSMAKWCHCHWWLFFFFDGSDAGKEICCYGLYCPPAPPSYTHTHQQHNNHSCLPGMAKVWFKNKSAGNWSNLLKFYYSLDVFFLCIVIDALCLNNNNGSNDYPVHYPLWLYRPSP